MIVLYATGSKTEGLGHISRNYTLSAELKSRSIPHISIINDTIDLDKLSPSVLVIDTRQDTRDLCEKARSLKIPIVHIDCLSENRFLADVNIYPNPHFNSHGLDWTGYEGRICSGAAYTSIHSRYLTQALSPERQRILVSFGGSDPNHLTEKVLPWLADSPWPVDAVIGPASSFASYDDYPFVTFHDHCDSLAPLLAQSGLLITALGITIYEAAFLNVPSIIVSNHTSDSDDEIRISQLKGLFPLGYYAGVQKNVFRNTVQNVIENYDSYSKAVGTLIDGKGSVRIVDVIEGMASVC